MLTYLIPHIKLFGKINNYQLTLIFLIQPHPISDMRYHMYMIMCEYVVNEAIHGVSQAHFNGSKS